MWDGVKQDNVLRADYFVKHLKFILDKASGFRCFIYMKT